MLYIDFLLTSISKNKILNKAGIIGNDDPEIFSIFNIMR
jgi:hypothetical protein